jgi:hypothetical protein
VVGVAHQQLVEHQVEVLEQMAALVLHPLLLAHL